MIAHDVIKDARYILSDITPKRWTDERLIGLLNDGLTEIQENTILYTSTMYLELVNGVADYDLSSLAAKILRIEYKGNPLDIETFENLDSKKYKWQEETGNTLKAYLLDKQNQANIKVYPIPDGLTPTNIESNSLYGIITDITYSDLQLTITGTLGDLGEIAEDGYLKIFYIKKVVTVTDINDELDVTTVVKRPLSHYIASMALRDNQDTQNRILAKEEMDMFEKQISQFKMEKAKNFSQMEFQIPYNPLGV